MNTAAPSSAPLSQDELKTLVGQAALAYVVPGEVVGVGTGLPKTCDNSRLEKNKGRLVHKDHRDHLA